ncbi:MAG: efflux RND transporter periplasmic adaptor subunit [Pseudomonadota bacterium]
MTDSNQTSRTTRQRAFSVFGAVLALLAVAWGLYWFTELRHYESTDDAYVAGDVMPLTSEAPGTVTAVHADDTQGVDAGVVLVELDPADARVAVAAAEATLARTAREVAALYAQRAVLRAELQARELTLQRARRDLARREPLRGDGAVSGEELAHSSDAVAEFGAAVMASSAQLDALDAQLHDASVATHPRVLEAAAAVRSARLALRRTTLTAPAAGVIAKRSVQIGQRVAPGTPLLAIVSLREVWIDANFKEVQLGRLRIGQPVRVRADVYGSAVTFHGRVAGLGAGSGSAFALLPAQNASGNWIKIVQRLPVRVALDAKELEAHPLRIGLSTTVEVDVADGSGPVVAAAGVRSSAAARIQTLEDPATEARIQQIVAAQARIAAPRGKHGAP